MYGKHTAMILVTVVIAILIAVTEPGGVDTPVVIALHMVLGAFWSRKKVK